MNLRFREKGLSPKLRRQLIILGLVFLSSLILFSLLFNFHRRPRALSMDKPSLPGISVGLKDRQINRLFAYTTPMEGSYMRGTITPLIDGDRLQLTIDSLGKAVQSLDYELRSADGQNQLASGQLNDLGGGGQDPSAEIDLSGKLEDETEYLLTLTLQLTGSKEKIYYYTRVLKTGNDHVEEIFDFARDFHAKSLSDQYRDLSVYLNDPSREANSTDLTEVNLNSGIGQIGYGSLKASQVREPDYSFTDINTNYCMLESSFILRKDDQGISRYFTVHEYFRVRYSTRRMYLMDYQRRMDPIQTDGSISVTGARLNLGVGNGNLNCLPNETGSLISFVSGGDLFTYDQGKKSLKRIFSFRDDSDLTDPRSNCADHAYKLLGVDESGSMDFVVYGYMNAGPHEGQVGINLYHYDSVTGQTLEKAFVRSGDSYQILKASFSDLLYMNGRRDFYLIVDGTAVRIDLNRGKTTELLRGLKKGQYAVSASGRYLAYTEASEPADQIHIMDFEMGEKRDLTASDGEKIQVLAFMGEDLAYGVIRPSDQTKDAAGNVISPMYQVKIHSISEDKELLTYQKDGLFVVGAGRGGATLTLRRVRRQGDHYVSADSDSIQKSLTEKSDFCEIQAQEDPGLGMVTTVQMTDSGRETTGQEKAQALRFQRTDLAAAPKKASLQLDPGDQDLRYFVYQGSRVDLTTDSLIDAIDRADADMGLVVDSKAHTIWRRDKRAYVGALSGFKVNDVDKGADASSQALSAILMREKKPTKVSDLTAQGKRPAQILDESLQGSLAVDLTGAKLSQVLYYVSKGSAVYALLPGGEAILIVGYSSDTIRYFQPQTGNVISARMDSISGQLEEAGNVFLSYVKAN